MVTAQVVDLVQNRRREFAQGCRIAGKGVDDGPALLLGG